MNTQIFKMVNDDGQAISYRKAGNAKRSNFLFLTLFAMPLLFSCTKNIAGLPNQDNVEASISNQSSLAQVSSSVETVPFERILFVPCANNGAGEEVQLTGEILIVDHVTFNNHGFTLTYHTIMQGLTGVSLTTGENFTVSGGSHGAISGAFENDQFAGGYIEQTRVIGQRSQFIVQYRFHVTVTSDGKITSGISDEKIICRN